MKPNLPRLRRLAALLRKPLPKGMTFDMKNWGVKTECGTAACAAGLAGSDPWFRARGFKLEFDEYEGLASVVYGNTGGGHACALFFRISDDHSEGRKSDVHRLFSPFSYRQPTQANVARRFETFIRKHEKASARA